MNTVLIKNVKNGYTSKMELPNVTREQVQAYVNRCNGSEMQALRERMKIGELIYSLE